MGPASLSTLTLSLSTPRLSLLRLHDHFGHPPCAPRGGPGSPGPPLSGFPSRSASGPWPLPCSSSTGLRPRPSAPLVRRLSPLEKQPHREYARRQWEHREDVPGPRVAVAVARPLEVRPAHVLGHPEAFAPQPAPQQAQGARRRCRHLTPAPRPPPPQPQLPPQQPTEPAVGRPRGGVEPAATPFPAPSCPRHVSAARSAGLRLFTAHLASPPTSLIADSRATSFWDSALQPWLRTFPSLPLRPSPASGQPWPHPHRPRNSGPALFCCRFRPSFSSFSLAGPTTATPLISGLAPLCKRSSSSV